MTPDKRMLQRLVDFVCERQSIYVRRQRGALKPWTQDPILQRYKFCNVYREQDRVTVWIDTHIRRMYDKSAHLWFMLCVARQINWPDTLRALMDTPHAWPDPHKWRWQAAMGVMEARRKAGQKVYTGAYMISGQRGDYGREGVGKAWLTCKMVLDALWQDRMLFEHNLRTGKCTLADVHGALRLYPGWGDFLAAQVVADLKHTRYLRNAEDWYDWAVLGPGSTRGLNRLYPSRQNGDRRSPLKTTWPVKEAHQALVSVRAVLQTQLRKRRLNRQWPLCLQDTQNCLCEFDKYERARLGQGRPRATFDGG